MHLKEFLSFCSFVIFPTLSGRLSAELFACEKGTSSSCNHDQAEIRPSPDHKTTSALGKVRNDASEETSCPLINNPGGLYGCLATISGINKHRQCEHLGGNGRLFQPKVYSQVLFGCFVH